MDATLFLGIDVGSTTVKVAILDSDNNVLFSDYERHFANIRETLLDLMTKARAELGDRDLHPMITGSGGMSISKYIHVPFVQEVISVSSALGYFAPKTDVAIELGGEDAKIIYFENGNVEQRMNGICAGGTGSFIDQMASLLETDAPGLNEYAKKIYDNSNGEVKGVGYTIEPTYYQHYLLESLNDVGFMDADGKGASCLDDGSMKQFLTDWYNWTEEGWCEIPALENASSAMQEDFYNGKLGAFVSSSNRATSISEKAQAAGINLGMSYTVGYGGYSAPLGGGSIGIIGKDHSQQEIAAAWEFVKFLMSDEQVAQNHIKTGVLPTTYSSVETDTLKNFWADEKNEGYKISYEQVKDASAPAMSMYTSEWNSAVRSVYSELIQARDITPDQALDNLKSEASTIFE